MVLFISFTAFLADQISHQTDNKNMLKLEKKQNKIKNLTNKVPPITKNVMPDIHSIKSHKSKEIPGSRKS